MENNLVPVGRNDDTSQRASPIHPAPPSQLFINDTTDDTNTAVIQADLEAFHKHRTSIALFLLLLFHFILAYVATFASLLFVILLEHRLRSLFDEQISLKSSTNRNTLWTIFATSACFLTLVHLFAPIALDITVVDRLTFTPFHSQMDDFISLFMLCYFTDSTLRILVCAIKIAIYFLLNPRSSAAESHGPIFPNFSCLRGNNSSAFSSFPAGLLEVLAVHVPALRGALAASGAMSQRDAIIPTLATEESDLESGTLLNSTRGRRREVNSREGEGSVASSDGSRDRALSVSSVTSESAAERHTEVLSYMRLKKVLAVVDSLSNCYRFILPLPVWAFFFSTGSGAAVLPFFYFFVKMVTLSPHVLSAVKSVKMLVIEQLEYGSFSTEQELRNAGTLYCPICFDNFYHPITLGCSHIFCQHCIHEWMDHENSCPVCRAEVSRDHGAKNSSQLSSMPVIM